MKMQPPCRHCADRHMNCHSECQTGIEYDSQRKAAKAVADAEKKRYLGILSAEIERKAAEKRKKRKR